MSFGIISGTAIFAQAQVKSAQVAADIQKWNAVSFEATSKVGVPEFKASATTVSGKGEKRDVTAKATQARAKDFLNSPEFKLIAALAEAEAADEEAN